jgi:preprotein translocase subunit SecD
MSEITKDPRIIIFVVAMAAALILLMPVPSDDGLHTRLKYGLDLEGGSWLQLRLQGAIVEIQAEPANMLKKQLEDALDRSVDVEWRTDSYYITTSGRVSKSTLEDLGYSQSKITPRGNTTRITITSSPLCRC